MSFLPWSRESGPSGFGSHSTAEEVVADFDLSGRTVLVTGSNTGLGFETARVLVERGARVLATARTRQKAEWTCERLPGRGEPLVCELSEPASIRSCVESVRDSGARLDALVANAGIMALPELETKYGYELQFLTNHVGHFLLVTELVKSLTDRGRAVIVSSGAHRRAPEGGIDFDNLDGSRGYDPWRFYGQSKLANLLFATELHRWFEEDDEHERTAFAVHPGTVKTDLMRHLHPALEWLVDVAGPLFMRDVEHGAATQVWAAAHPDAREYGGEYLVDCDVAEPTSAGRDRDLARRLWSETESIVEEITRKSEQSETRSVEN